jgi:hypothetical protein
MQSRAAKFMAHVTSAPHSTGTVTNTPYRLLSHSFSSSMRYLGHIKWLGDILNHPSVRAERGGLARQRPTDRVLIQRSY